MDYSKTTFFDVFAGGGSVYTNILDKYDAVLVNDIILDLIKIHKSLILDDSFVNLVKSIVPEKTDKESFLELRNSYNKTKTPEKLYALMLSCTNNMMRFNKSFEFGERGYSEATENKITVWKEHVKPFIDKIIFVSLDFEKLFKPDIIDKSMFYLDPPYSETEAGYNAYWSKNSDRRLYKFIHKINDGKGSFMLSGVKGKHKKGEESWIINELIKDGFNVMEIDCSYEKVARIKNNKESVEVIIKNY